MERVVPSGPVKLGPGGRIPTPQKMDSLVSDYIGPPLTGCVIPHGCRNPDCVGITGMRKSFFTAGIHNLDDGIGYFGIGEGL